MLDYHTHLLFIVGFSLIVLSILVFENDRLSTKDKIPFYLTYFAVAFAAFNEWLGLRFNGNANFPIWALKIVKAFDYTFTLLAGGALAWQLKHRSIFRMLIQIILCVNIIFQIACAFTDGMVVVDEATHTYSHGPLYVVYMILYIILIILIGGEFVSYGQKFRRQIKASLYVILIMSMSGILIQEFSPQHYRTAYVALTIAMAMMYIHYTEFVQISIDDNLREQKIQLMLSQIKPHFIYNSLSSISALCETDPMKAQKLTDDFSEYLRAQLDAIGVESEVTFEKALEQVEVYVHIEQVRFGDRIKMEYDLKEKEFMIPTMTLQPIVENAIRHGICKKEDGGTVRISSYVEDNNFVVEIKDDGVGFDVNAAKNDGRSHVGMKNVRARLEAYGDRIETASEIGKGTTTKVYIPKKNVEEAKWEY